MQFRLVPYLILVAFVAFAGISQSNADTVTFETNNEDDPVVLDGDLPLGSSLDNETTGGSTTLAGINFELTVATTLGDGSGEFNATGQGAGINSDGVTGTGGDASAEIDFGEELTFTLTFGPELTSVSLTQLDLGGIGTDESAIVTIGSFGPITLQDGFGAEFGDTNSNFDPATPISLVSGDQIVIAAGAGSVVQLDGITLDIISAVPEPTSVALIGLGGLMMVTRRRR